MARQGEEDKMDYATISKLGPTPTQKTQPETQPEVSLNIAQPQVPEPEPQATDQIVQTGSEGGV